eukprot:GCRY01002727.1.p1 GENE.GCRY01002727.1~~GCRY01002727.1.p1  ORF type:complete len:323 (+),score=40.29 GCRY01002727.1:144-1112(+)
MGLNSVVQDGISHLHQKRCEALKLCGENEFSLVSYNILRDIFFQDPVWPDLYSHCDKHLFQWSVRKDLLTKELSSLKASVVCLQEVDIENFEKDFFDESSPLAENYRCITQTDRKKRAGHTTGVATFFRQSEFECVWESHRSRALIVALKHRATEKLIYIVNSHLEGNPKKPEERVNQLRSVLQVVISRFQQKFPGEVIVCGDFNCQMNSCPVHLLLNGSVSKGMMEEGISAVSKDFKHPFQFKEVSQPDVGRSFTFMVPTMLHSCVDFIFATTGLQKLASMPVLLGEDKFVTPEKGIPSFLHPSDHVPIGTVLKINPDSSD